MYIPPNVNISLPKKHCAATLVESLKSLVKTTFHVVLVSLGVEMQQDRESLFGYCSYWDTYI